jgi:hypothetical protein
MKKSQNFRQKLAKNAEIFVITLTPYLLAAVCVRLQLQEERSGHDPEAGGQVRHRRSPGNFC